MSTADPWTDRLSEYLDDELTAAERRDLEQHLAACSDCRAVLGELRQVLRRTAELRDRPPLENLWPAITVRLESDRSHRFTGWFVPSRIRSARISASIPQLAAAAVLIAALSGALVWFAHSRTSSREASRAQFLTPHSTPGITMADFGDAAYDSAVADLQKVLEDGRDRLDPTTVAILERNLAIIDEAIRDARAALEQDPSDLYLNRHFAAARQRKLDLLRRATALAMEHGS